MLDKWDIAYLKVIGGLLLIALSAVVFFGLQPGTETVASVGRFDVSVHYEDSKRSVYTVLDTIFCKNYLATSDGGLEFLEINKPCLNKKKPRNQ